MGFCDRCAVEGTISSLCLNRLGGCYMYQLLVTEQSGIQTFSDLRGKRIALPPKGSGQYKSFWFLAEHYGLQPKDLTEFDT
jgi:TRAP-type uncharacterized transport system substrate-binding protein